MAEYLINSVAYIYEVFTVIEMWIVSSGVLTPYCLVLVGVPIIFYPEDSGDRFSHVIFIAGMNLMLKLNAII